ncbi:flagellar motor protein MotB [Sabulicella glaciei]|uniref:OmpA family protein n=1 Tax=Sabulicella glaciei TaxID=2984948 RepID=A0ABT3NX75_9PROT|nr:OmpA family protein [Roseococcus sp. MDT2-1-1]
MAKRKGAGGGTIVLRRIEEGGHGHHGGAWKVAYADFVTAMMAFFLLMWLLNATTEEQRRGLADYFNPTHALSNGVSGTGQPFGGSTPHAAGRMASETGAIRVERGPRPILADLEEEDDSPTPAEPFARREGPRGEEETPPPRMAAPGGAELGRVLPGPEGESDAARLTDAALRAELARREEAALQEAAAALRDTLRDDPSLSAAAGQFLVEVTPEGLRIQLLEADGQPMFSTGNAAPSERARAAIRAVAQAALRLPNPVSVSGHTDSAPFRGGGRSNWDLAAERANAARRLLTEAGLPETRLAHVSGHADREPLLRDQPGAAANRRVAITLLRQAEAPR